MGLEPPSGPCPRAPGPGGVSRSPGTDIPPTGPMSVSTGERVVCNHPKHSPEQNRRSGGMFTLHLSSLHPTELTRSFALTQANDLMLFLWLLVNKPYHQNRVAGKDKGVEPKACTCLGAGFFYFGFGWGRRPSAQLRRVATPLRASLPQSVERGLVAPRTVSTHKASAGPPQRHLGLADVAQVSLVRVRHDRSGLRLC